MSINVLLTCAGRRNYMVEYFKKALCSAGEVHCINSKADTSAMYLADKSKVLPSIYAEGYVDEVLNYCLEHDIKLALSLFDLELPILAPHRDRFRENGITLAISAPEVCGVCLDKVKTHQWLQEADFLTVPFFTSVATTVDALRAGSISFPLFVKPRLGMGSIGLRVVRNLHSLGRAADDVRESIQNSYLAKTSSSLDGREIFIQCGLPGKEYGLDIINDFSGDYVATFVKQKLGMRSGETDSAITKHVPELERLGRSIGEKLKHIGILDTDVFWDGTNAYILELNPRFGGGYPFSHIAGSDLPSAYIDWSKGVDTDSSSVKIDYGVTSVKGITIHKK